MGFTEMKGVFRKEIREARRDGRLSLILFASTLVLLVAYLFSFSSQPIVAVVEEDGEFPRLSSLSEAVKLRYFVATEKEALEMLRNGKVAAVVCFKSHGVEIFAENSYTGLEAVKAIYSKLSEKIKTTYIPSKSNLSYLLVLGVIGQGIALLLASTAISREKEEGTLEMLLSSKLPVFDFISAKFFAVSILSIIAVSIGAVILILTISPVYQNYTYLTRVYAEILLLEFLVIMASAGVGLIFSVALSRDEGILAAMIFLLANVILSFHSFYPFYLVKNIAIFSYFLPLLQAKIAFGLVEIEGANILSNLLMLILYTLISILIALIIFKKREKSFVGGVNP